MALTISELGRKARTTRTQDQTTLLQLETPTARLMQAGGFLFSALLSVI